VDRAKAIVIRAVRIMGLRPVDCDIYIVDKLAFGSIIRAKRFLALFLNQNNI
jgi:hypothetical protein